MDFQWLKKPLHHDSRGLRKSFAGYEARLIYFRTCMERRPEVFKDFLESVYTPFVSKEPIGLNLYYYVLFLEREGRSGAEIRTYNSFKPDDGIPYSNGFTDDINSLIENLDTWYERHSLHKLGSWCWNVAIGLAMDAQRKKLETFATSDIAASEVGSDWIGSTSIVEDMFDHPKFTFSLMGATDYYLHTNPLENLNASARKASSNDAKRHSIALENLNSLMPRDYHPKYESKAQARERIKRVFEIHLRTHLDEVLKAFEAKGGGGVDAKRDSSKTGPVENRFHYLYHHHVEGWTMSKISAHYDYAMDEEDLENVVRSTAELVGIDLN